MSDERLLVTLGNMQKGTGYLDPPRECELPIGHERIEVIAFNRIPSVSTSKRQRVESKGRWVLTESWTPEKWNEIVLGGAGGYDAGGAIPSRHISPPLKSGRLVKFTFPEAGSDSHVIKIIGRERGYWVVHHERRIEMAAGGLAYSDDGGKTWLESELTDPGPMKQAWPSGQVTETGEGTIAAIFYGYKTEQDMLDHRYCSVIARSYDDGETWGDWSFIGCDSDRIWSYCEPSLLVTPEGLWVAFMRTETPANLPWMSAMMTRSVSLDEGRTWSRPIPSIVGSQPAMINLPGGEIAFIVRSTARQNSSIYFSRDLGETWDYALEGAYNTSMAGLLDENRFWVWANNEALIYERLRD
jgi:hypothetical protein